VGPNGEALIKPEHKTWVTQSQNEVKIGGRYQYRVIEGQNWGDAKSKSWLISENRNQYRATEGQKR